MVRFSGFSWLDLFEDFGWHWLTRLGVVGVDLVFVTAALQTASVALPCKGNAVMLASLVAK